MFLPAKPSKLYGVGSESIMFDGLARGNLPEGRLKSANRTPRRILNGLR